jgi:hypothetical protein
MKLHQNILLGLVLSAAFALSFPLISPELASPPVHSAGSIVDAYPPPITVGRTNNLSTRGLVGSGDEAMVSSFSVQGGPVDVVVRALGPDLASRGVPGELEDPMLQLYQGDQEIQVNENWADAENADDLSATGLAPREPDEAAIYTTLEPGEYTGIVMNQVEGSGIGLLEIFKAGGAGELVNLSTRGRMSTGHAAMVGGFIPDEIMTVLITATGPSLENIDGSDAVQDPILRLYHGRRVIAENDNWADSPFADYLREEGLAPADPRESAIIITISPWARSAYTAIMHSVGGSSGIGQVGIRKLWE